MDRHGKAGHPFCLDKSFALVVENVERHVCRRLDRYALQAAGRGTRLDGPDQLQRSRRDRTATSGAVANFAWVRRCLQHALAATLARDFHQAELRDAAMLDAGAVNLQAILHLLFDGAIVLVLVHVDEVDHDEAREVAQAHLAAGFFGGFQVGAHGRLLDIAFLGRLARVHIDGDQGFGLVDHQVAAGFQLHGRRIDRIQLVLDGFGHEQRIVFFPLLNFLGLARHDQLGEVLGFTIGAFALHPDFLDVLVEHVAHGAVHKAAFGIDQHRRFGGQRFLDNGFPEFREIIIVAPDFGLGALGASRPHDQAHAVRHVQFAYNGFQALAVCTIDDLAGNAAAARRVRHQHGIAAGKRKERGQGRALVAAFLLDDLYQ